ncbi:TPA: hypothetical protein QEM39_000614 [Pseudomonas putida]|uniref:hypothetical protein n=1 Tax=Pseudomonas putida TaxID=303 RepID=UPI0023633F9B|nr:hypothetical protein [Pseudomonas putida]MDD2150726.1 hypothetical protein [Pseudomonas putida]HDS1679138.1 hypothetical protein [Pseudomonas putida]
MQMADPHDGMLSFQQGLSLGILEIDRVPGYPDLYSHFDVPTPGTARFTYARLSHDRKTVEAFLTCVMNGKIGGMPCVAVGYAVPETNRSKGYAKSILRDVVLDQAVQAKRAGHSHIYIEAVADVTNLASQKVAQVILKAAPEEIVDSASSRPALRYTAKVDTASGTITGYIPIVLE